MALLQFRNILIPLLTLCSLDVFSQEQAVFGDDYLYPFITNPACTGSEYYPVAGMSVKKQWLGFPDSPATFLFAGNFRVGSYDFYDPKGFINDGPLHLKDRVGLGASVFQDKNGPLSTTGGILSYAYSVPVNADARLSFGLSAYMFQYALNSSILKPDQANDPYLLDGNESLFRFNVGIGAYYHTNTWFGGISFIKLLPGVSAVNQNPMEKPGYFLMGGYKFNGSSNSFNFEPSLELKKWGGEPLNLDVHAKLYVKKLNWIAASFSTAGRANFRFGIRIYKMVYAGYNYECNLSNIVRYNYGTHEISLGINLGLVGVEGLRQAIRSSDNR